MLLTRNHSILTVNGRQIIADPLYVRPVAKGRVKLLRKICIKISGIAYILAYIQL